MFICRRVKETTQITALVLCIAALTAPFTAQADTSDDDIGQLMFDIMIGELAGRRGDIGVATESYIRAAQISNDARIAKRATQLAVWGLRWDDAEAAAKRWLSLTPDSSDAYELLAQIYLQTDQNDNAIDALSGYITHSKEPQTAIDEVMLTLLRGADRKLSMKIMAELGKKHPEEVDITVALARMSLAMNERQQAIDYAELALTVEANNGSALLVRAQALGAMGKPEEGFVEIRKALKAKQPDQQLRIGFAQLLVAAGRFDDAIDQLDVIFKESASADPDLLLNMSLLALQTKRSASAIEYLTALVETGEHSDQANFYLGQVYDGQQKYSKAIEHYFSVGSDNLYLPSQLRAAELHGLIGELDVGRELIRSLKEVISSTEAQTQIIATEASMLNHAGDVDEAIALLSKGLKQFPNASELLYARAITSDANNDSEQLVEDLGRLIELEPDNAHAMNALGYHLVDNNTDLERASDLIERAYKIKPNDAAIIDSLGWLRYRQGKNEAAMKYLAQAYELLPDPEIAAHLGEVMWVTGDQSGARKLWDKALLNSPEHKALKAAMERLVQ